MNEYELSFIHLFIQFNPPIVNPIKLIVLVNVFFFTALLSSLSWSGEGAAIHRNAIDACLHCLLYNIGGGLSVSTHVYHTYL